MNRFRWTWMSLLALMLLCGCRSTQEREEWEARYRDQRDEITLLKSEVNQLNNKLALREQEGDDMRNQIASTGKVALSAEQASLLYSATGIHINRMLSGGIDRDGFPGDDALSILMAPHDEDGSLVKLVGAVEIELLDLAQSQQNQIVGSWNFTAADVKAKWHAGLVGAGYLFELDWQTIPENQNLLLHVRLNTGDGRQFDLSEKFAVNLPQGNIQTIHLEQAPGTPDEAFQFPENNKLVPIPEDQRETKSSVPITFKQESSLKQSQPDSLPLAPEEVTSDSWEKSSSPSQWK